MAGAGFIQFGRIVEPITAGVEAERPASCVVLSQADTTRKEADAAPSIDLGDDLRRHRRDRDRQSLATPQRPPSHMRSAGLCTARTGFTWVNQSGGDAVSPAPAGCLDWRSAPHGRFSLAV